MEGFLAPKGPERALLQLLQRLEDEKQSHGCQTETQKADAHRASAFPFLFSGEGGVFLRAEELFAVVEIAIQEAAQVVLPDGSRGQVLQPWVQGEDGGGNGSRKIV